MFSREYFTIMEVIGLSDRMYGWSIVMCSTLVCQLISVTVSRYCIPDRVKESNKSWHWKNITVSLIHSVLIAVLSITCFYFDPKIATDMIDYYTTSSLTVICISYGYFVYDTIDMIRFHRKRQSFELLLHHIVIMVCFGISITLEKYVAYANVALVIEVNSIFLHTRQLMQLYKVPRTNVIYRLNSLVNLATYIVFRIGVLSWMTRWVMTNKDRVPLPLYSVGSLGLATMTVMNIVLFYRLLMSDYIRKKKDKVHQS